MGDVYLNKVSFADIDQYGDPIYAYHGDGISLIVQGEPQFGSIGWWAKQNEVEPDNIAPTLPIAELDRILTFVKGLPPAPAEYIPKFRTTATNQLYFEYVPKTATGFFKNLRDSKSTENVVLQLMSLKGSLEKLIIRSNLLDTQKETLLRAMNDSEIDSKMRAQAMVILITLGTWLLARNMSWRVLSGILALGLVGGIESIELQQKCFTQSANILHDPVAFEAWIQKTSKAVDEMHLALDKPDASTKAMHLRAVPN